MIKYYVANSGIKLTAFECKCPRFTYETNLDLEYFLKSNLSKVWSPASDV